MKKNIYCVILGDIDHSRQFSPSERKHIQKQFQQAIEVINREFKHEIISHFLITLGDEFQGVLKSIVPSYQFVCRWTEILKPVNFSFGIGEGEIVTPLQKKALGMDGPAFHRARAALEEAKRKKQKIIYNTGDEKQEIVLNTIILLLDTIKKGWTARQKEVIANYLHYRKQNIVAQHLKTTKSTVSEILASAHWPVVEEAEKKLDWLLKTVFASSAK